MRIRRVRFDLVSKAFTARPRLLAGTVAVIAVLVFVTAGWLLWFSHDVTAGLPDREAIRGLGEMAQSTTIFDASDKPAFTIFKEQRIEVPLTRISPNLIKAVIAVEDQRFYDHQGVDMVRIAAAFLRNFREGRRAEGGSTITQQLARQAFLTRNKTYRRKLKEALLAAHIENQYSKDEILELYLNKVYFGDGYYGVEAASRGYLGKSAADLTVDEAALLAGLIQSPTSYAPTANMERAVARRNLVLQMMLSTGAVDSATAQRARRAKVQLTNALEFKESYGLYFKEHVRRELVERFGWERVSQGGLRVYTTMDTALQQAAEALVEKGLRDIEQRRGFKHPPRDSEAARQGGTPEYLQGALVSVDAKTGYVRAMVGGRDFWESRFNRAAQAKRQSGSAFKPFVFATAIEAGYSPASVISNLNDPILTAEGDWVPEDEHSSATSMTLRTALKISSNRAAVQLLRSVGIPTAVSYAEKLNIGTPPSVPSLALGASDVTLLALTAAYGAFADRGSVHQPVFIRRVEDSSGNVLFSENGKSHRAVSEATAFLMASMLSDVVNHGTAYRARQAGFTLPAAGKTGTTNDYVDAWFVGFTPRLVTGVWIGFDQPKTIIANGYAGELAVPIWAAFMKRATSADKPEWFERPREIAALNVCRISGKLPNAGCSSVPTVSSDGYLTIRSAVYTEYFRRGTQPSEVCPLHPEPGSIDTLTATIGSDETPRVDGSAPAEAVVPASAAGTAGTAAPERAVPQPTPTPSTGSATQDEPPAKRRGFWSRLFGGGDDKDKDKEDKDKDKKNQDRRKSPQSKQQKPGERQAP